MLYIFVENKRWIRLFFIFTFMHFVRIITFNSSHTCQAMWLVRYSILKVFWSMRALCSVKMVPARCSSETSFSTSSLSREVMPFGVRNINMLFESVIVNEIPQHHIMSELFFICSHTKLHMTSKHLIWSYYHSLWSKMISPWMEDAANTKSFYTDIFMPHRLVWLKYKLSAVVIIDLHFLYDRNVEFYWM